jgi:predicted PurR-regulated permease PerM
MRHSRSPRPEHADDEAGPARFAPHDLTGLFAAPRWLRDLGQTAWLAVGIALLVVGLVALLALTQTIVAPLLTAIVVGAVSSPLVAWLQRHRLGRGAATGLVLIGLILLGAGVVYLVLGAVTSQSDAVSGLLSSARDTITGWLKDSGVDAATAEEAKQHATSAVTSAVPALLEGIGGGLKALSSLAVYLALTTLSLFFLLKDGPLIRGWIERQMRVPADMAHGMTGRVLQSLRGYFFGVTLVAAFNAVIVALGAIVLGVPLPGTIAAVTFLGAYIPYLGAWSAGAFSVLVALGGAGTDAALGMIVVQLLANGLLQQLVQPIAYGAALGIHPLAVLVVTIAGGALFGAIGLVLAAPLTSAATHITADLSRARPAAEPAERPADTALA